MNLVRAVRDDGRWMVLVSLKAAFELGATNPLLHVDVSDRSARHTVLNL